MSDQIVATTINVLIGCAPVRQNVMLLIIKILLVPTLIALITLSGRVWGSHISGILTGLPLIVGPILVFLAIDRGDTFAAIAANAALAGVISIGLFCFVYAVTSQHGGVPLSLCAGLSAFLVSTYALSFLELPLLVTLLIVIFTLFLFIYAFPEYNPRTELVRASLVEIFIRMGAAAVLVLLITYCSNILGPKLSGLLAPFPIAGTILAGFTHHYSGGSATRQLLNGFIRGLFGMALFSFTFALLLNSFGLMLTLLFSISLALIASSITIRSTKIRALVDPGPV